MLNTADAALFAQSFAPWSRLSPQEQAYLTEHAASVHYQKGANLHSGEAECLGLLILKSGALRTYLLSEDGREITLYRMGPGEACVLSASCVISAITFDVHIDAEEDTELFLVAAPAFATLSQQNIYVECWSYRVATERFSDVIWALQQVLFMRMDQRLAVFLLDALSRTQGDTIKITHEQAARYIGSAREVVSRMLKYFAAEGVVEVSRGWIRVLGVEKLRKLAA